LETALFDQRAPSKNRDGCHAGNIRPRSGIWKTEAGTLANRSEEVAMRLTKLHLRWDDRLDAIPPLAGSFVAFISLMIVLTIAVR
jgi:hypothetical protein